MNFSISKNNFIKFSNSYKEKGAKGAFLDLIRWTKNRIKLIFNIKDSIHKRREYLSKKIYKDLDGTISYGPFKGLKLSRELSWGNADIGSILFGFYEKEVLDEILRISQNNEKKYFIDIGAADGYYALGVLFTKLFDYSYCFELTKKGREVIYLNSKLNNLDAKVSIKGKIDGPLSINIKPEIIKESFILIDIEGYEFSLLNEQFIREIQYSNVIIEIHEYFFEDGENLLQILKNKLRKYFQIKELTTEERNLSKFKELDLYSDSDRWLLCSEGRYKKGKWLVLVPYEQKP